MRDGRREEFKALAIFADPQARGRIPDPQADATFSASRLRWEERRRGEHACVLALYRSLIALRTADAVLRVMDRRTLTAEVVDEVLIVTRSSGAGRRVLLVNFGQVPVSVSALRPSLQLPRVLLRSDGAPTDDSTDVALSKHTALVLAD